MRKKQTFSPFRFSPNLTIAIPPLPISFPNFQDFTYSTSTTTLLPPTVCCWSRGVFSEKSRFGLRTLGENVCIVLLEIKERGEKWRKRRKCERERKRKKWRSQRERRKKKTKKGAEYDVASRDWLFLTNQSWTRHSTTRCHVSKKREEGKTRKKNGKILCILRSSLLFFFQQKRVIME